MAPSYWVATTRYALDCDFEYLGVRRACQIVPVRAVDDNLET